MRKGKKPDEIADELEEKAAKKTSIKNQKNSYEPTIFADIITISENKCKIMVEKMQPFF